MPANQKQLGENITMIKEAFKREVGIDQINDISLCPEPGATFTNSNQTVDSYLDHVNRTVDLQL